MKRVAQIVSHALDFCYPGRCATCDEPAPGTRPLCDSCLNDLVSLERQAFCTRCALPLTELDAPCPRCLGKGRPPYEHVHCLCRFDEPVKGLIHGLKYHNQWPLAEFLADRVVDHPRLRGIFRDVDCLLPVPLHRRRQIIRGYNQADVLATRLARLRKLRLIRPVVRLRHTETQTHLHSRQQRMENLRDSFGLTRPNSLKGRHVLVVDDVMTTGATLHALGVLLQKAEPASLSALVIAVADPKHSDFEVI